jgi:hypothetical protein
MHVVILCKTSTNIWCDVLFPPRTVVGLEAGVGAGMGEHEGVGIRRKGARISNRSVYSAVA